MNLSLTKHLPAGEIDRIERWFDEYTKTFGQDENIILKIEHTRRVIAEIGILADSESLDPESRSFARLIALLHDIGRFDQYRLYGTYADAVSVDHAALGVAVLEERQVLEGLEPEIVSLVKRCIRYHNRAYLPQEEGESCLYFSRMLRDADKLDIWKVVISYYRKRASEQNNAVLTLGLADTPGISREVSEAILEHRIVDMKHVKSINDVKMLQAGWVFDCNLPATLRAVRDRAYLESLEASMSACSEAGPLFAHIQRYLLHII